jgi:hypothetical protein
VNGMALAVGDGSYGGTAIPTRSTRDGSYTVAEAVGRRSATLFCTVFRHYVPALIKSGINASFAGLWVGSPTMIRRIGYPSPLICW